MTTSDDVGHFGRYFDRTLVFGSTVVKIIDDGAHGASTAVNSNSSAVGRACRRSGLKAFSWTVAVLAILGLSLPCAAIPAIARAADGFPREEAAIPRTRHLPVGTAFRSTRSSF